MSKAPIYSSLVLIAFISILMASGCATNNNRDMYYWGSYESTILKTYTVPGDQDPATEISQLESDIQQAKFSGKKVPPGEYAYIGFLQAAAGNRDLSIASFEEEKQLFPESAKFIDGMMNRALKGNKP